MYAEDTVAMRTVVMVSNKHINYIYTLLVQFKLKPNYFKGAMFVIIIFTYLLVNTEGSCLMRLLGLEKSRIRQISH